MRAFWMAALLTAGCGLSPGLKAAMKQPSGYSVANPAPAEQVQRISSEGPIKWFIESPVAIAIDPVISSTETDKLGIEDPAAVMGRSVAAALKTRGYPDAPMLAKKMRFVEEPPVVPADIAALVTTPYLLHLQVAVEATGNDAHEVRGTLVVFDKAGTMQYRTRCKATRADDAPAAAPKDQWAQLEQQCATDLMKEF